MEIQNNTIQEVLNQRNIYKNRFREKNSSEQGFLQDLSLTQKPTIEAISEVNTSIKELKKKNDNKQNLAIESNYELSEIDEKILKVIKESINEKNKSRNFNTLSSTDRENIFVLGSSKTFLFGLKGVKLLSIYNEKEYKINSIGLAKLLFLNNPSEEAINSEDLENYINFLKDHNQVVRVKNKKILINKLTKQNSPIIEELDTSNLDNEDENDEYSGKGIKETIILPSDVNDLSKELILQLESTNAGNSNTFNYTNAIMKELLQRKIITIKDYRNILRVYYHI